jgi:hypothetical protein
MSDRPTRPKDDWGDKQLRPDSNSVVRVIIFDQFSFCGQLRRRTTEAKNRPKMDQLPDSDFFQT